VIVVILIGAVFVLNKKPTVEAPTIPNPTLNEGSVDISNQEDSITIQTPAVPSATDIIKNKPIAPVAASIGVLGNKSDLVSFSIAPGASVSGVMSASGSVRGAYFFEGNIVVRILGVNKAVLRTTYGTATSAWMTTDPVTFNTTLDFTGLTTGPGYVELHNDNASGLPENDKSILIPVIIQ
ncbi:MAG: Gmad2 immunoglobulin-like domain-containing protein, partial [Minisyncoccia bacterium]